MYIENAEGFEGEGDLFTKFGIELRDQANFVYLEKGGHNLLVEFKKKILDQEKAI